VISKLKQFIFVVSYKQAIQQATASEPLTLDEEYENQESWRASHDKLTFIICEPLPTSDSPAAASSSSPSSSSSIKAGEHDARERMVGDVNLFLYPDEEEEEDRPGVPRFCVGEVDIMIADAQHRGRGLGREVVGTFLQYISRHRDRIMEEYAADKDIDPPPRLKILMAKINEANGRSISLFSALGFEQEEGGANYFGEVKLVLRNLDGFASQNAPQVYRELVYSRDADTATTT